MEERPRVVRAAHIEEAGGAAEKVKIEEIFDATSRVQPPQLINKVDPEYTEEARIARHEGAVVLQADITAEGQACNFRLVRSLGLGLDEKAVAAVMQWKFQPARDGKRKVAYRAMLEINFRLL
jgi:TonB family protein